LAEVDRQLAYSDKKHQNFFPVMHKSNRNMLPFRATTENPKFLILRFSAFLQGISGL
jgi:hypothetical protein